jgi:hypothetical protein
MRPTPDPDTEPLEILARPAIQTTRQARQEVARSLLALARGDRPLDHAVFPGDLAGAFLRRYADRTATQEAYSRDLADWFVWLDGEGVRPFDATLATVEKYIHKPLPNGKAPAPATTARRLACLSAYYKRAHYEGLVARNPVELAARPKVPEQAATAG